MRRTGKAIGTLAAATSLAMVGGGLAVADEIKNNVSIDGSDTFTVGGSTTVKYRLDATKEANDPNGPADCNASTGAPVSVTITGGSGVTVTPSSLTFTSCNAWQDVVFTASTAGVRNVTVTQTTSVADINVSAGTFALKVVPRAAGTVSAAGASASADVSWIASADASSIDGYKVFQGTAGTLVAEVAANRLNATVGGLINGTQYCYTVRAYKGTLLSAVGNSACATPAAPSDTTPPDAPTIALAASSDSGSSDSDRITNVTTPKLEGAAEAGSTVKIFSGTSATPIASVTAANDGKWDHTIGTALAQGVHTFTATATDASNNASQPSTALSVTVDTTAPVIAAMADQRGLAASSAGGAVTWTAPGVTETVTTGLAATCQSAATPTLKSGDIFPLGSTAAACNATDAAGNAATTKNFAVLVSYDFSGFRSPLDALPTKNMVKAGRAIPVKFSLGGDMGMDIFANTAGSALVSCTSDSGSADTETVTAGSNSLSYDDVSKTYTYIWKTDSTWAGKCRDFKLNLKGASTAVSQSVLFGFTK